MHLKMQGHACSSLWEYLFHILESRSCRRGSLIEQHRDDQRQPQGNTQSLWKCFGIIFCLISLCTVYTFSGQSIIRGALWCGVFLQRALPSANGCGLKWAQALNAQHKHWKSSVIQGTSEKLIEESVGKPNPWQCQTCLGLPDTLFWGIPRVLWKEPRNEIKGTNSATWQSNCCVFCSLKMEMFSCSSCLCDSVVDFS